MSNKEREKVWEERVAHWRISGLSQRAYSIQQGYTIRQFCYWVRRLTNSQTVPELLPVRVSPAAATTPAISLRNERGWTLSLPGDVSASWLAELMRAL